MYLTYTDYLQHWDEIASIFSRESILKGSFDTYAEATKGKRGTAEVDTAFLQEIESWREMLAKQLALRNKQLTQRELNYYSILLKSSNISHIFLLYHPIRNG